MVTRYTAVPSEISIVDRPCCPTAKFFTIHKRDGSVVKREFAWTHELTLIDGKLALVEKTEDDDMMKGGPGSGRHAGGGGSMTHDDPIAAARDHAVKAKTAWDSGTRKGAWSSAAHDSAASAHYAAAESIKNGSPNASEHSAHAQNLSNFANNRDSGK
jgi:hypothetical protein